MPSLLIESTDSMIRTVYRSQMMYTWKFSFDKNFTKETFAGINFANAVKFIVSSMQSSIKDKKLA